MPNQPQDYSQDNRAIKVDVPGLAKDTLLLERFKGTERISGLYRFTLDLLAVDNTKVHFEDLLGKTLTVTLNQPGRGPRYFYGMVNRFTQGNPVFSPHGAVAFYRYHADILPRVWLLTRTVRSRVFQHKTVPQILETVFQGYDEVKTQFMATYQPRDYCVQYQESDLDFACRLMEEEGIYYYFTHPEGGYQMQVVDSDMYLSEILEGSSPVYFRQVYRELAEDEVVIQWEKSQEIRSGKYTVRDRNFELTSDLEASSSLGQTVQAGTVTHQLQVENNAALELYRFPGGYATRFDDKDRTGGDTPDNLNLVFDERTRVAGLRMQEEAAPALVVQGMSNSRRFAAGATFTLADHFDADGSYLLTRVDHLASVAESYLGGAPDSFEYANSFQCSPSALTYRPPRATPRPRIEGPQTAVVVGQQGDEIFTDKHGRVKVQFYWDRDNTKTPDSSCWVRVGSIWAGAAWGAVHIPRVGQEVIVAFLDGDPDRPIIVGSVYNNENTPPYTLPDNKTQSGIKSRSTLQGDDTTFNELRFEDLKGSELVYFHAEKDFQREVENNDTLTIGVEGSNSLKDGSQTITVYKNRTATIKTGNESLTVEQGNRSVTVSQGDDSHEVTTGKRTVTVNGDDTHEIKTGKRSVTIDTGDDTLTLKLGSQTVQIQVGNQSTKLSVGSSTTEAMTGITLKVGANSVEITPAGITLKGMMVNIQGQAMTAIKAPITQVNADGMLMLKGGITMVG
jgi:type VI secretion system secreted protein VgrG